jgi:hypothetical protein
MPDNCYGVGARGDGSIVIIEPPTILSRTAALEFAAWIVSIAEREDGEFECILRQVQNT